MSNFRFIEKNIDVSNIVADIRVSDWEVAATLPGAAGNLKPYGFLPLTMAVVNNTERGGFGDAQNTEMQKNTPMFSKYRGIRKWLKTYKLHRHSRAAFFRLRAGESVERHIDEGTYYLTRDRYHLSLRGSYEYTVGDEMHVIEPGTFFWFDNKNYHSAYNCGDIDRLTFVFDVPKSKRNP